MHSSGKQFQPNSSSVLLLFVLAASAAGDGNDRNASSGLSLSRTKRLAIFNGQGTNKVDHRSNFGIPAPNCSPPDCRWLGVSHQAGGYRAVGLGIRQLPGAIRAIACPNLLVEFLEHLDISVHRQGVEERHPEQGFPGRDPSLAVRCCGDGIGAVCI